jgi:hypothetical protein
MKHNQHTLSFRHDEELIGTLVYVFITQKRYDILKLSQQLGMEYADLYAYVAGRRTMPVTLLRRITEITGDKIFFDTVFGGSNIVWSFKQHKRSHSNNPSQEALETVEAVGEMCKAVKNSMKDGHVSETEKIDIIHRIAFVQQELMDLLEAVKQPEEAR